jgi:organic radical activating enzyme
MMGSLQIAHIEYSITTKSLDIFTIGCNGCCEGCCNPEIKDWNLSGLGVRYVLKKVRELNDKYSLLIDKVVIVGGDPCDAFIFYPTDMKELLVGIRQNINKPIFLFTRHDFESIPLELKDLVDYIKTGEYKPELSCDNNICFGIKLATSNQKIYKKEGSEWKK